jgi:hypothetical protein
MQNPVAMTMCPWRRDVCSIQHVYENKNFLEISVTFIRLEILTDPPRQPAGNR